MNIKNQQEYIEAVAKFDAMCNDITESPQEIASLLFDIEQYADNLITIKNKLYDVVQAYINTHNITCGESVYQSDQVLFDAQEFLIELCNIVGYAKEEALS